MIIQDKFLTSDGLRRTENTIYPDKIGGDYDWSLLICEVYAFGKHVASVAIPRDQG